MNNLWSSVGNTPLLYLKSVSEQTGCQIFGKAEFMNPGGSVKDRASKSMILDAERSGRLQPGGTIVEGTAGNTGIGLAMLGAARGYKVEIFMPNNQAKEKYELLKALGARLHLVDPCPFSNPLHFYHQAKMYAEQIGGVWMDQFENLANSLIHEQTTSEEIWLQMDRKLDVVVASVGTGGTIGGLSKGLRRMNANLKVIAADPYGSGVYSFIKTGEYKSTGASITEGIGIMRKTANFSQAKIDDAVQISDQEMYDMFITLSKTEGLFLGPSAALNVAAAKKFAELHQGSQLRIVTILCDHGSRYLSKMTDQEFLQSKGIKAF